MVLEKVKARRVGDSLVVTLTKPTLEETGIAEGDILLLEIVSNKRILIAKEATTMSIPKKLGLEVVLLNARKSAIEAEMDLAVHEHNNSTPTAHPGIVDNDIMEGCTREWNWELRKLEVEIAQKRLELFELGGE